MSGAVSGERPSREQPSSISRHLPQRRTRMRGETPFNAHGGRRKGASQPSSFVRPGRRMRLPVLVVTHGHGKAVLGSAGLGQQPTSEGG